MTSWATGFISGDVENRVRGQQAWKNWGDLCRDQNAQVSRRNFFLCCAAFQRRSG